MNRSDVAVSSLWVLALLALSTTPSAARPVASPLSSSVPSAPRVATSHSIDPTSSVSTVACCQSEGATASSPERKVFYSSGYWWVFWDKSGTFTYSSSSDGSTWSSPVEPSGFASETSFSVWVSGDTVYYAASTGASDFLYTTGALSPSGTISWAATESTVTTTYPTEGSISITVDSLGNPWVAAYTEVPPSGYGDQYTEVWELSGGSWSQADLIAGRNIGPEFIDGWVQVLPLPEVSATVPSVAVLYSFIDCTQCFTGVNTVYITGFSGGVWRWSSPVNVGPYAEFSATAIGGTLYVAGSEGSGGIEFSSYTVGGAPSAPVSIASGTGWEFYPPDAGTDVSISQGNPGSNLLAIFCSCNFGGGPNVEYFISANLGSSWSSGAGLFGSPQTIIEGVSSADAAGPGNEFGLIFVNYNEIFDVDFATVTVTPTGTEVQAPLSDSVGLTDTFVPPATAPLSDTAQVTDTYIAPAVAALSDTVNLVDKYVSPAVASLTDVVGIVDQVMHSLEVVPVTIVFHDPPGNILITTPSGGQAGCDATGDIVNTIGAGATISGCSPSQETVTISNPAAGLYKVQVFGTATGPLTVSVETLDSQGDVLGTTSYDASVTSGSSQTFLLAMSANGAVAFTTSILGVPEFSVPGIIGILALLLLYLDYFKRQKARAGREEATRDPMQSH